MEDGGGRKKIRIDRHLEVGQVAAFLRSLAEALEGGGGACLEDFGIDLADFSKIKLGLEKGDTGELHVKITVREAGGGAAGTSSHRAVAAPDHTPAVPAAAVQRGENAAYRDLKKTLKASWAGIGRHLDAGELPPPGMVADFAEAADRMILFPGYGDPGYEAFATACKELRRHFAAGDCAAMAQTYQQIRGQKKDCHARFK